jgi:hypothetical protein
MSQTVYRIRAHRPLLWRTPTSVQIGVDEPRVIVDNIPDTAAPLIHALHDGISAEGVEVLAKQLDISGREAHRIVQSCAPSFAEEPPCQTLSLVVMGSSTASRAIASLLEGWGAHSRHIESFPVPDESGVVVLVADYLADPNWNAHLTHTSLPHLPVIFSDLSITAGPLITPGMTPCLGCHELWHRQREPEWLSLGSRLWASSAPTANLAGAHRAATLTALLLGLLGSPGVVPSTPGMTLTTRPQTG